MALTDFFIQRKAKPGPKPKEFSDKQNGLAIVVFPSGVKSWIVRFKSPVTMKQAKFTIGPPG